MSRTKRYYIKWITAIGLALIAVLFIRLFVASPFVIPSQSMENTLFPGDYILVSKWQHGARLPRFPLQWSTKGEETKYSEWIDLGYTRLPGLSQIERNDLIAFGYPIDNRPSADQKTTMLKRAVGMPGDTISIHKGKIYINDQLFPNGATIKHYYVLIASETKIDDLLPEHSNPQRIAQNSWKLELTHAAATQLKKHEAVSALDQIIENPGRYNPDIYPSDPSLAWNAHYIDEFFIPKKGSRIQLNASSFNIYRKIIRDYEQQDIQMRNDSVFLNNKLSSHYSFRNDYYWMLGDNRDNSLDSRYWGLIPEDHIIGKVSAVLFSWNKDKTATGPRWERSFSLLKKDGSLQEFRWVIYSLIAIFVLLKIKRLYVKR